MVVLWCALDVLIPKCKSLNVFFGRDLEGLILYCIYGVSVPSLHREPTDSDTTHNPKYYTKYDCNCKGAVLLAIF